MLNTLLENQFINVMDQTHNSGLSQDLKILLVKTLELKKITQMIQVMFMLLL